MRGARRNWDTTSRNTRKPKERKEASDTWTRPEKQKQAADPDRSRSRQVSPKTEVPIDTPPTALPPSKEYVPKMFPMPQPTIEEPPSDAGSVKGKKPVNRGTGMPAKSANEPRPRAPSACVSPLAEIGVFSSSPLSSVSSLLTE
jgi:hypothetical protein